MDGGGDSAASFYEVLGVTKDCSEAEIRSAYRKLARKWHPDKWPRDPSAAEQAKSRFQQIQEAYSVLSDDTKRTMYDAGVYEAEDDVEGFTDFLDEMASMMATVQTQTNKEDSFEELQEMFTKMVNENWLSTDDFSHVKQSEPSTTDNQVTLGNEYFQFSDFWNGEEAEYDEWFDEDDYDVNMQDNLYSFMQDHDPSNVDHEDQGLMRSFKKPRVCTGQESGRLENHQYTTFKSFTSTTFVV